jgi:hypothetical protein
MPMRYASQPDVLAHLKISATSTDAITRVTSLENGLADAFDAKVGRSFGVAPVAEARTLAAPGVSPVLVIPGGIRSITGITTGGTWDGAVWLNPEILDADDYALWATDRDGISYGIESFIGAWVGPVHVTGIWADQSTNGVPADIREAMTFLTVRQYRRLTASPTDLVGPDGLTVPTPHAWDDPLVKAAIERHRLVEVVL